MYYPHESNARHNNGVIMVEYYSTHNNHSVQLAHLPVPSDIKPGA